MSHSHRFAELRQLVFGDDGFTREEIRYMRCLLSGIHTDLVGELPLEIITLVALRLQPEDFACCLRVSHVWRQRFLSDPVMAAYARHFWPAMIDGPVDQAGFLGTLARLGRAVHRFRLAPDKADVESVSWDNTAPYPFDPVFHSCPSSIPSDYYRYSADPDSRNGPGAICSSGKVAWCPRGVIVVVDDLRSRTRKVFTPPSGTMHAGQVTLRALGSGLVVGTLHNVLVAWDHIKNRAYEASLPRGVIRCATQDDRVAVLLWGGDVLLWTVGQAVIQLETIPGPVAGPSAPVPARDSRWLFFDPRNNKTVYMASWHVFFKGAKHSIRFIVNEYSAADRVASWLTESEISLLQLRRYQRRFNDMNDLPIIISDYEFDHGCIFLGSLSSPRYNTRFAAFNKLEKRFIDPDQRHQWYWFGTAGSSLAVELHKRGRTDLDFHVLFSNIGYTVKRSKLPQSTLP